MKLFLIPLLGILVSGSIITGAHKSDLISDVHMKIESLDGKQIVSQGDYPYTFFNDTDKAYKHLQSVMPTTSTRVAVKFRDRHDGAIWLFPHLTAGDFNEKLKKQVAYYKERATLEASAAAKTAATKSTANAASATAHITASSSSSSSASTSSSSSASSEK